MASDLNNNTSSFFQEQYKRYIRMGYIVCGTFFLAVMISATLIKISGAITAKGTVVQIGENKAVQHSKGGPIKELLVEEGDVVTKGQTIIILDSVSIDSKLARLKQQDFELSLTLDRLNTMIRGDKKFIIDAIKYQKELIQYPEIADTEQSVFTAQTNLFLTNIDELDVRLSGLKDEIKAINKQRRTSQRQLSILDESITELNALYKRQLISKSRITSSERDRVTVLTQLESLKVTALQKKNIFNETTQRIEKITKETKEKIWQQIEKITEDLAKVKTEIPTMQDDATRLEIKAPVSGRVHKLIVNNINEIIKPGDAILEIVPSSDNFIIYAQVKPADIEQLFFGQETRIRFDTFNQQSTPEIIGRILFISADSINDEKAKGEKHFLVKVSLEREQLEKISDTPISSGLPVSTMFTTTERSLLNYLTKPLTEQLFSAFREN
ncbi:MAG: HlyD family type I secretion membrane fusion protein [Granulosicoccus sp.]|jgi:HlyD family type I secretion membrane fusion protein